MLAVARFAVWSLVLAVSYTQAPLYSYAQNQYFLHGLADAGFGYLHRDWLAGTVDPTPVFSALVTLTHRYLPSPVFYLYYVLLFGAYFFSTTKIAAGVSTIGSTPVKYTAYTALFVAIHSATVAHGSARIFGIFGVPGHHNLRWFLTDGVAAQSTLESVFQPSTFGVFILLSIYLFISNRPLLSLLPLAVAITVHPGYMLSAAELTIAYMLTVLVEDRNIVRSILIGLVMLILASPMIGYALIHFGPTSPEIWVRAHEILATIRIPWHALPHQWWGPGAAGKVLLVGLALYLVRGTRLFRVLLFSSVIAAVLTAAQVVTKNSSPALLFPWRVSVLLLPVSTAVVLGR